LPPLPAAIPTNISDGWYADDSRRETKIKRKEDCIATWSNLEKP